jgi:hypothetical protein
VFTPKPTAICKIRIAQPRVNLIIHRSEAAAKEIVDVKATKRELEALLRRKYLWADDTVRLRELAAMFGLQVQMQRHHFTSGDVEKFAFP